MEICCWTKFKIGNVFPKFTEINEIGNGIPKWYLKFASWSQKNQQKLRKVYRMIAGRIGADRRRFFVDFVKKCHLKIEEWSWENYLKCDGKTVCDEREEMRWCVPCVWWGKLHKKRDYPVPCVKKIAKKIGVPHPLEISKICADFLYNPSDFWPWKLCRIFCHRLMPDS